MIASNLPHVCLSPNAEHMKSFNITNIHLILSQFNAVIGQSYSNYLQTFEQIVEQILAIHENAKYYN